MKELDRLIGKKMTKKERQFQNELRRQYKEGKISLMDAHKQWDLKVLKIKRPDWWYKNKLKQKG